MPEKFVALHSGPQKKWPQQLRYNEVLVLLSENRTSIATERLERLQPRGCGKFWNAEQDLLLRSETKKKIS